MLVSVLFFPALRMVFLGACISRYHIDLTLGFPFVSLTMSVFLRVAFKAGCAAQKPRNLHQEPLLMKSATAAVAVMGLPRFVRVLRLESFFAPTLLAQTDIRATDRFGQRQVNQQL